MVYKNLAKARKENGDSQAALSKKINVNRVQIARYETGVTEPPATYIKALTEIYDVSADFLLETDEPVVQQTKLKYPNLAKVRKENKDTQESLSQKIGISRPQIARYETDVNEPPASYIKALSDLYKVSADFLLAKAEEQA